VLWVYSGIDGNRKDNARLEQQVNDLTRTVGNLQITVAAIGSEVRASRSDQARDAADIKLMLQQRPAPAPRTANAPIRRTTQ
jgi:outer membrane murein-binding lipoprotein Lpp